MCDPLTIAATAATVGGSLITGRETANNNKRMVEARNAATQAELDRQHAYQDQAGGVFTDALTMFSPEAVASRLSAAKGGAGATISGNLPGSYGSINTGVAPNAAVTGEARTIADLFGKAGERSTNMGNLIGYDQFGFDNKLNLTGTGRQLDTISDFSGNSARVGGLEQEVAPGNAYKAPSGFGELLTMVGQLGGNFAGKGGFGGTSLPTSQAIPVPRANPFIR